MQKKFGELPLRPMPGESTGTLEGLWRMLDEAEAWAIPLPDGSGAFTAVSASSALGQAFGNAPFNAYGLYGPGVHMADLEEDVFGALFSRPIDPETLYVVTDGSAQLGWLTWAEAVAALLPSLLPGAGDFMSSDYVALPDSESVYTAHKALFDKQERVVLALDGMGQVSGVLTDRDISKLIERGCDLWNTALAEKAPPAVTVTASTPLKEVRRRGNTAEAALLVVTDDAGHPLGTISVDECTRALVSNAGTADTPPDETVFMDTVLTGSLRTGIVGTDEYLNIIYYNEAITDFVRNPDRLKLGGPIWEVIEACAISRNSFASALDNAKRMGEQIITNWMRIKGVMQCIQCRLRMVNRNGHTAGFVLSVQDITAQQNAEEAIRKLAYHDKLTQLPNRLLFDERLDREIKRAKRNNSRFAIMMLDLDGFKRVNDDFGHSIGDLLLCTVGKRLYTSVRESDTVARFGGDEFIFILPDVACADDVEGVAEKMRAAIREPCIIEDREFEVEASIGFSIFPEDAIDSKELLDLADARMYKDKRKGTE